MSYISRETAGPMPLVDLSRAADRQAGHRQLVITEMQTKDTRLAMRRTRPYHVRACLIRLRERYVA